jgi:hypothetical protein
MTCEAERPGASSVEHVLEGVLPLLRPLVPGAMRRRRLPVTAETTSLVTHLAMITVLEQIVDGAPPFDRLETALHRLDPANETVYRFSLQNIALGAARSAARELDELRSSPRLGRRYREHLDRRQAEVAAALRRPVRARGSERRLVAVLDDVRRLPPGIQARFLGAVVIRAARDRECSVKCDPFALAEEMRGYLTAAERAAVARYLWARPSEDKVRQDLRRGRALLESIGGAVAIALVLALASAAGGGARGGSAGALTARGRETGARQLVAAATPGRETGAGPLLGRETGA